VLFINADREFTAGRAQNYLGPQHVEKIVSVYHEYCDIPGFARVVDITELRENDFNLNIRRYVDNTPPAEPQDVRAHLNGGIPKAEVEAHAGQFAAYGIDVFSLFTERDSGYCDFPPDGWQGTIERIPALSAPKEAGLQETFADWWARHVKHITELPDTKHIMETRADLLDSFVAALEPMGVLDRYQLTGAIASWWGEIQYDVKTLAFHNFNGVVQGWLTTIESAFTQDEDGDTHDKQNRETEKRKAREHRVVPALLPDYLVALEQTESRRADLEANVKAVTAAPEDEEGVSAETPDPAELSRLKADLAATKRDIKRMEMDFLSHLKVAAALLDSDAELALVLRVFLSDLRDRLMAEVAVDRRSLTDRYRTWADKYEVTLRSLEAARGEAATCLNTHLKDLGYV
jgi:type I restriction enzyme M protein